MLDQLSEFSERMTIYLVNEVKTFIEESLSENQNYCFICIESKFVKGQNKL